MRVRARTDIKVNYWLTAGKEYDVIGLDHRYFRLMGDGGEPTLFERRELEVLDDVIPADWVWEYGEEGDFYADPPGLHERGFWELYFDHKPYAVKRVNEYLARVGITPPAAPKARQGGKKRGRT